MKIIKVVVDKIPKCFHCIFWEQVADERNVVIDYCLLNKKNIKDSIINLGRDNDCILEEVKWPQN